MSFALCPIFVALLGDITVRCFRASADAVEGVTVDRGACREVEGHDLAGTAGTARADSVALGLLGEVQLAASTRLDVARCCVDEHVAGGARALRERSVTAGVLSVTDVVLLAEAGRFLLGVV